MAKLRVDPSGRGRTPRTDGKVVATVAVVAGAVSLVTLPWTVVSALVVINAFAWSKSRWSR